MADKHTLRKYTLKAIGTLREQGVKAVLIKGMHKSGHKMVEYANQHLDTSSSGKIFVSIVSRDDVLKADVVHATRHTGHIVNSSTKVINWVISPPRTGGGHQNMFRFIEHLDRNGYVNNVYLYSTSDFMTIRDAEQNVSGYATLRKVRFFHYKSNRPMAHADALFATGWETAYPVLNENTTARKFYFVQDFEPLFFPVGTEYILAENTYKFGFHGITAGNWLAKKLSSEYGMVCDAYDFGAEKTIYTNTNESERKEVFFYARPVTERRAFDLGIMVLELFHKKHPEYTINLAGWDVSDYDIPFPYVNHKTLPLSALSALYNKCVVGLVLSLTNMSLMPLELLACGVIPVVNDGENNRLVSNNKYIEYAFPTPKELSDAMSRIVTRKDQIEYAAAAAKSVSTNGWERSKDTFLSALERELYG